MRVRTFLGKTTPQALEYVDQHINEWIEKEHIKVVMTNQGMGVTETKGGAKETCIFINVWFEKEAPQA